MFNSIRVTLTLWYVGILLVIVLITSSVSYILLSRGLRSGVDDSLRLSAANIASQLNEDALERAVGKEAPSDPDGDGGELQFVNGIGGDTFYLVLTPEAQIILNPLNINLAGLTESSTAQAAFDRGEVWRTIEGTDVDYRTYILPVFDGDRPLAIVEVGRSTAESDDQLDRALLVLAVSGATGLILAVLGGLLVADRALRPIRGAFNRQREFVANASHEMRTPLALVRGNTEMLELSTTAHLSAADRQSLGAIVAETGTMERLIGDLSTLAEMDEATLPLQKESFDAIELLDELAAEARLLARDRDLFIETVGEAPVSISADRFRVRECLTALVDNAIRETPDGGRITLEAGSTGRSVELRVSDTGPGIPEEHRSRIFDRFYRTDRVRSRKRGGSGLGLAIARSIATAHGGDLTLAPSDGQGATFVVRIPNSHMRL